jgi:hypothetical protein
MPLMYSVYLQNIAHTISRNLTSHRAVNIFGEPRPNDTLTLPEYYNRDRKKELTIVSSVYKQLTKGMGTMRDKNLPLYKVMVKCLNVMQTDTEPFIQAKNVK